MKRHVVRAVLCAVPLVAVACSSSSTESVSGEEDASTNQDSPTTSDGSEAEAAACKPGELLCAGDCVDAKTDKQNCGGCGTVCKSGESCVGGLCVGPCTNAVKDGAETDVDCGGSGACARCVEGKTCAQAGDCVANSCVNGVCKAVSGASCEGLAKNCGATADQDCCDTRLVTGGTFPMGQGKADAYTDGKYDDEKPEHDVTVSDFKLDTYEVTVARFRQFAKAYPGSKPAVGAGAHALIEGSGWQQAWDDKLPPTQKEMMDFESCNSISTTWTADEGKHDTYPINCVGWHVAFAFCAWDGGRLPTEAEWEYAAAGGSENRLYPWGATAPGANPALANCSDSDDSPRVPVGSHPLGAGRWGHQDLAGGLGEWVLDAYDGSWYSGAGKVCDNCANLDSTQEDRVNRGGAFEDIYLNSVLRAASRERLEPSTHYHALGFRCARSP